MLPVSPSMLYFLRAPPPTGLASILIVFLSCLSSSFFLPLLSTTHCYDLPNVCLFFRTCVGTCFFMTVCYDYPMMMPKSREIP